MRPGSEIVMTSLNRNDVTSNYQTGVKWTYHISSMSKNNRYKVGTHASFYFQLIISQTIKLTDMWLM